MRVGLTVSDLDTNPMVTSKNTGLSISLYQTPDSLMDAKTYRRFVENAVRGFRRSKTYTQYKQYLIELGLNRCALQSNLTPDHCSIEMHHNILTIFDIAFMITEHLLNTVGRVCTYDVISLLKYEHTHNNVGVVMLNATAHQVNHASDDFFIHPKLTFGNWTNLLEKYKFGVTPRIANKVIRYLHRCENYGDSFTGDLLKLRESLRDWSYY